MSNPAEAIQSSVRERFTRIAQSPASEQKFPVGPTSALAVGYLGQEISSLPAAVVESFCGVGDPLALGQPQPGQTVVDLGCGAGLDSILAARRVGPSGKVIGVDMTPSMIDKARGNASALGMANVEFVLSEIERLPMPDASADLAITNGVFNLCFDKPAALAEAYRILRPAGRLQMADMLLEAGVTEEEVRQMGEWSD